ncbi:MAG: hypothetical protein QOH58_233 [Thermoleophilaceae bacterium]|jgi:hypothetical protein|nr:hypothetical protein [Thermoleophilaceae bacterium]
MQARKRLIPLATAAAALTYAVAGTGTGSAQDPVPTLELVAPDRQSKSSFVDAPPRRRESAGDLFTVSSRLRDATGRPAGRAHAVFVQTTGTHAQGSATFVLASGHIVATGVLDAPGRADQLVVVGGSGAYAGASGTVAVIEERNATRFRITLGS